MNNALLVDTNIVSYLLKRDSRAELYRPVLENQNLVLSLVSVAELRLWSKIYQWQSKRIQEMESYLQQTFTVVGLNDGIAQQWAEIQASSRAQGRPITSEDCWLAATALELKIPLVTHNAKHFQVIPNLEMITFASPTKE